MASIFNALMNLVESNDAFLYKDLVLDDVTYRLFDYRLASYSDFLPEYAREARGIMFDITDIEKPILVCRPMEKFFNLNENPFTLDLDLSNVLYVMDKLDGSLISTYLHKGKLRLKSKMSLDSDQALMAMDWLNLPENANFKESLEVVAESGLTVSLELTSPLNQVVVKYENTRLRVINIRDNTTGRHLSLTTFWDTFFDPDEVVSVTIPHPNEIEELVAGIKDKTGIEGYVLVFPDQLVKVKTDWYRSLHSAKEGIDIPSRLFESVLCGSQDDLRAMVYQDSYALSKIDQMEKAVLPTIKSWIATTTSYVNQAKEKGWTPKDVSEGLKRDNIPKVLHSPVFCLFRYGEFDFINWARKNRDSFGIDFSEIRQIPPYVPSSLVSGEVQ